MKFKALVNLLPIVVVVLVIAIIWQQWQTSQALKRPDYDNPAAPLPTGLAPRPESMPVEVVNVHDGDTITVQQGWQKVRVRLCGIDAPELDQPLGVQSRDNLRSLLASVGNQVNLYVTDTDRYGRKVAEVFVPIHTPKQPEEERFVNGEQVQAGMAYLYARYASRCPNGGAIAQMEAVARQQRRGVWREPNAQTTQGW